MQKFTNIIIVKTVKDIKNGGKMLIDILIYLGFFLFGFLVAITVIAIVNAGRYADLIVLINYIDNLIKEYEKENLSFDVLQKRIEEVKKSLLN